MSTPAASGDERPQDDAEAHRRLLFWERTLTPGRPCRGCQRAMFVWFDITKQWWEMCRYCDVG